MQTSHSPVGFEPMIPKYKIEIEIILFYIELETIKH